MNLKPVQLDQLSPAFVLGVAHTVYQALGERFPPRMVQDPERPWRMRPALGALRSKPGEPMFHRFEPDSADENSYQQGRAFAAMKFEQTFQTALQMEKAREESSNSQISPNS